MSNRYEAVIGLEVHVQLATATKIFCACSTEFGAPPNTRTCPVCLGLPGVLPILNARVVDFALQAALALNCRVNNFNKFDRKNYFYPDMTKGYQISQYDLPLAEHGYLDVADGEIPFRVGIRRIHLEEDAGKLVHPENGKTFIDYNRVGVPLIEIVTEPQIKSPRQARVFLTQLRSLLKYLEISDCNMEEGSLRCDANLSIRLQGTKELGTKTELKNMNSFKALEKALGFELERQTDVLRRGEKIRQETRTWDETNQQTFAMRGKEEAEDYRYFPDPDLVPLVLSEQEVDAVYGRLPELPRARKERFISVYDLSAKDAQIIIEDKALADFFEEAAKGADAKKVGNWLLGDFLRLLKEAGKNVQDAPIQPNYLVELIELVEEGRISGKMAKEVFAESFSRGMDPKKIVEEKGLSQLSDTKGLMAIVMEVIGENQGPVADYRAGKKRALDFLMGQVMKKTKGRANPQTVAKLLQQKLKGGDEGGGR